MRAAHCRWKVASAKSWVSRRALPGVVNTLSKDIEGKSARLLERHRQVEALDPEMQQLLAARLRQLARTAGDATWRSWRGLRVGWLPLPFHRQGQVASPTLGRGGYHGCATWPTITAAAATQGSERAGVQDEGATTAHTLSGASPAHHIHARTQDRRVARAASVLRAQPLSPAPRQRRGGLHGQTERLSAHAGSTQIAGSSQQSGGVTWPPVVAGTQAEVRSGEGKGGGSPARAGRCALRCGRCGGRKEPSPRCVGRGSALPGPLLW